MLQWLVAVSFVLFNILYIALPWLKIFVDVQIQAYLIIIWMHLKWHTRFVAFLECHYIDAIFFIFIIYVRL